jgi:hypothetical protein
VVASYLLGSAEGAYDQAHRAAEARAERVVDAALARPQLGAAQLEHIAQRVAQHWRRTGYAGDVSSWIAAHTDEAIEA